MRKITLALLTLMVAAVLPFITQSTSHAASYKTVCEKGSGTSSGRCYKQRSAVVKKVRVVDAVPLINRSSKRVTMTCNFSSTITKGITAGGSASVTTSAEASFMKIAKASVSATYTLHASVRMSSAQAKSAGGTVTLKRSEEHTSELQSLMRISY